MTSMYASYTAVALNDAIRRLNPVADGIRQSSLHEAPISTVEDFWESNFPLSCVALPNLCLQSICRYITKNSGSALPAFLQVMVDTAGAASGRPVRGACIAYRGRGLLIVDENDEPDEQRFTLMHEGSHFLLDHYLPRYDAMSRMGQNFVAVLDGLREPTLTERFDAVLRRTQNTWHTHLYERNASFRGVAELDADILACLLLSPPRQTSHEWVTDSAIPLSLASLYNSAVHEFQTPVPSSTHPLLKRLGL